MPQAKMAKLSRLVARAASLPAFPSLSPAAWEEVEGGTAWVLDNVGALARAETGLDQLFSYAQTLYDRGDESGAEEVWEALFKKAPEQGASDTASLSAARLARCSQDFNDHRRALEWCRRGKQIAKTLPEGHPCHFSLDLQLGLAHQGRQDLFGARQALIRAARWTSLDDHLALRWERRTSQDLRSTCYNALADVAFEAVRRGDAQRRAAHLAEAQGWLERAFQMASSEGIRTLCRVNWAELLILRGHLPAARSQTTAILADESLSAATRERFRPLLLWLQSLTALMEDDLESAQRHARLAFESLRGSRQPAWEKLILRNLVRVFTRDHERRYGGHREETVLRTLEGGGSWILGLVDYVAQRDGYLAGNHGRIVESLCRALWEAQADDPSGPPRLVEVDLSYLRGAALLHDVGELDVSWALLNRVRPYGPAQERRFREHVITGSRILEQLGFPMVARIAEEHHERADGTGYPLGSREQSPGGGLLALGECLASKCTPSRAARRPMTLEEGCAWCLGPGAAGFHPRPLAALRSLADSGQVPRLQAVVLGGG